MSFLLFNSVWPLNPILLIYLWFFINDPSLFNEDKLLVVNIFSLSSDDILKN